MLSLKSAFFPYTFLYLLHPPEPPKLSISLYINWKRASNMVFNYIFVSAIWFRFFSFSCGILPLSAAAATFRSHFVKLYVTGVYRKNEPHGQVRNDVDMDRVLLARSNSPKEATVKGGQVEVNRRVPRWQDSISHHVKICMTVSNLRETHQHLYTAP